MPARLIQAGTGQVTGGPSPGRPVLSPLAGPPSRAARPVATARAPVPTAGMAFWSARCCRFEYPVAHRVAASLDAGFAIPTTERLSGKNQPFSMR